jgi:hypothetical protein
LRDLGRGERLDIIRLDVAGRLDALRYVLRRPFAIRTKSAELPEQLQFLGSGDGLQGTSCPERVDFICRKFAD